MLNDVKFIKGEGGLGRPLPGQDYVSGMLFYVADGSLPSGFSTTNRVKQFFALSDAENAGISADYSDATAATGSYLVTAVGADGDTIGFAVMETGGLIQIGSYTKTAVETTVTAVGAKIAAAINAGTINHGYTASAATGTVTITAPKKFGIFLNTGTPLAVNIVGTIAGTLTAFSGGVASLQAVWHYHIAEFFRLSPKGVLYVGFYAIPGSYTFTEITSMQSFAVGAIRQIGIYKTSSAYSTADMIAISAVCKANDDAHKPLSAFYAADLSGTADISTLADLATLNSPKVSDCISQDGGALGLFLYQTVGKSITCMGAQLGAVALAKVSVSFAWVQNFNISNGTECEVLAFANGKLYSDPSVTDGLLSSLNDRRHIFLRKFVGFSGSYFNDTHTAIVQTSDYAYVENNRTIDKSIRLLYVALLPFLNGPLILNANGTLTDTSVAYLESLGEVALDPMVRDAELSAKQVTVDPVQNVLATSKIIISVVLVINGVARNIEVPIGFGTLTA